MPRADRYRVLDLSLAPDEPETRLREQAAAKLGAEVEEIAALRIARKSLDARRRGPGKERRFRFRYHVDVDLPAAFSSRVLARALRAGSVRPAPEPGSLDPDRALSGRVAVVGAGPAGLFAARVLAAGGLHVDLIDRGARLDRRGSAVVRFHRTRTPDPETNLLFGEGGAGTYSDGKLYTRIEDALEVPCLRWLVDCGAEPDILYDSRAHIGTDRLHRILPRLRADLEGAGVVFHWNTRLDDLVLDRSGSRVRALLTTGGEIPCDALFLAPGHSARDTIAMLQRRGAAVDAKPFQLGVRIEHPQELIDAGRYGNARLARELGASYYNLSAKATRGSPAAHSFCMCPGGKIVASVNAPGELCTNGMSNSLHSSPWANAAIVTTLGPAEYGPGPLAGIDYQERLERAFFVAGGSDYTAPAQRADDFLAGRTTAKPRRSSYTFGTCPGRIDELLPPAVRDAIGRALVRFDRSLPGFAGPAGLLVGLESRSSGPIRLSRDRESFRGIGFENLYPMGEGAGYAGGIMSAAIDGARAAKTFLALPCIPDI